MAKWECVSKRAPKASFDDDDSDSDDDFDSESVRVIGNEVYFWGAVSRDSILELTSALKKLESSIIAKNSKYTYTDMPGITLYINSEGGDMFAGLSALDTIWNMRLHVTTVADGQCASAGTFILLGGHTRMIKQHSVVLIHQISTSFWGKYTEQKDDMKASKKFMKIICDMYRNYTKIPQDDLKKKLMKKDVYLTADECLKYEIVHEIC